MRNEENITRYTAAELDGMLQRGEDESDWERVRAMTDEEVEAAIDEEEEGRPDWRPIWVGIPPEGERHAVYVDVDVVAWFEATGDGWMSRLNDVLRDYVAAQKEIQERAAAAVALSR